MDENHRLNPKPIAQRQLFDVERKKTYVTMKNNQHQGNEVLFATGIHKMIHMEYNYIVPIFGIYSKARHTDMVPHFLPLRFCIQMKLFQLVLLMKFVFNDMALYCK